MHTKVMHWGRKWPRPKNHLDGRICPECATTVHGNQAQHTHLRWHADLAEFIASLSERTGIGDEHAPVPWTAAVDEHDQEAISEEPGRGAATWVPDMAEEL